MIKLGNLDDALSQIMQVLKEKPQHERFLCLKGKVLEKMNRSEEAENCYKQIMEKSSQALYLQAAMENKKGNFDTAIDLYNKALSFDSKDIN